MCLFSLGQLKSISSLKQISWCFNQNSDVDNYNPFLETLNGIAQDLNIELNKQQQQDEELQDYNEILGIKQENIKILGFAQSEQKWKKGPKTAYYGDWRQYHLQEAFSEEAHQFGVERIKAFSNKFQEQLTQEMMKDLNSFFANLCKQWDSIKRLPDPLEFSDLIQHQENVIMKKEFENLISRHNIEKTKEMLDDIRDKIIKKGKDIDLKFFIDFQEDKDKEAENILSQIQSEIKQELEKLKNQNKIQKKVYKKYENMIENRIKSSLQEFQLAMRNEIQNSKIEFQKQKGFFLLDKYVVNLRFSQDQLLKLKNDHDLIKKQFDEIWKQIIDQQTKSINDIFQEFAMQLFQIITKEFSDCYLRSKNESDFQTFFLQELVKQPPQQQDFEKIFTKFSIELKANQFVPIERSLKNRIFNELFHRDFDLKLKSQKGSDLLKLSQFFGAKIQVFYVDQNQITQYLKLYFVEDLKLYIQKKQPENSNSNKFNKLVNEFFTLLFCFGISYDQKEVNEFTKTMEGQSQFFNFLQNDERKQQKLRAMVENMFTFQNPPILTEQSELNFKRIKEQYQSLEIKIKVFETKCQANHSVLQSAQNQLDKNTIIIHIARHIECSFSDDTSSKTFQYIQNQQKYYYYQNTFKTHISAIIQNAMTENNNSKWKELYQQIQLMVQKEFIEVRYHNSQIPIDRLKLESIQEGEIQIPQYNANRIRFIMQKIEIFIQEDNKQLSNFGIILNDIGQRCIYYFSLLIIWRLLCYGQWMLKSEHIRRLNEQTQIQFNKFKADILENQLEQSVLRGNALAVEVYNNFLQIFYSQNTQKAQNFLRQYQRETSSSLIKQLDQQILEKGDPQVSDQQIMDYIKNQVGYIEKIVKEKIQIYIEDIQRNFQQQLQQQTKKLLLDIQKNSKNLKELSIDQMKAKDYFKNSNVQHEKILFEIVIQCLQGKAQIEQLKMINEENQDAFSLINPTPINSPLIDNQRSSSDYEIQILKNFIIAFADKIQDFIQNCHKLQIDLNQLNVQNILDEIKLVQIGCLHSCPICKRKCDQDQREQNHKHACSNGHQLRGIIHFYLGMNGVLINNNPSLYTCEEINDQSLLQIQETEVVKSWKEIKNIYNQWKFTCFQNDDLKQRKIKMINIWNNKIGKMICKQLEQDLGVSVTYIPKLENQQQLTASKNIHYILILDSSGSMGGQRWNNVINGVMQFMFEIQNPLAKITVIIFNNYSDCVIDFAPLGAAQQQIKSKLQFKGGGTNFDQAFLLAHQKIQNNIQFDVNTMQFRHQILFYTDGEAPLPTSAIQKFQEMKQDWRSRISLIACCEAQQSPVLEQLVHQLNDGEKIGNLNSINFQKSLNKKFKLQNDNFKC